MKRFCNAAVTLASVKGEQMPEEMCFFSTSKLTPLPQPSHSFGLDAKAGVGELASRFERRFSECDGRKRALQRERLIGLRERGGK